jgi:hypothetical protein
MKRSFNYTGRRDIPSGAVKIRLQHGATPGDLPKFVADVSGLAQLHLAPEAKVYVEPYVGAGTTMRFALGTVAAVREPADTAMTDLDANAPVLFPRQAGYQRPAERLIPFHHARRRIDLRPAVFSRLGVCIGKCRLWARRAWPDNPDRVSVPTVDFPTWIRRDSGDTVRRCSSAIENARYRPVQIGRPPLPPYRHCGLG